MEFSFFQPRLVPMEAPSTRSVPLLVEFPVKMPRWALWKDRLVRTDACLGVDAKWANSTTKTATSASQPVLVPAISPESPTLSLMAMFTLKDA